VTNAPDGKKLLAVSHADSGPLVLVWDSATGKELGRFEVKHPEKRPFWNCGIRGVALSPDGATVGVCLETMVADGGQEHLRAAVVLFDWRTGKRLRTFTGPFEVYSFTFSPDGATLAAACQYHAQAGQPVRVWEVATGKELAPFAGPQLSLNGLTFSADGKRLFAGPLAYHTDPSSPAPHCASGTWRRGNC
jgi:WD40 repeat protein